MKVTNNTWIIFLLVVGVVFTFVLYRNINTTKTENPAIPKNAVVITIQTADTKAEWLRAATDSFNKAGVQTSQSHPVYVEVQQEESPGSCIQDL